MIIASACVGHMSHRAGLDTYFGDLVFGCIYMYQLLTRGTTKVWMFVFF